MIIGVDLDNTIVSYDDVLAQTAVEQGLIRQEARKSKKAIRDAVRKLPDGEIEWQKLQAEIYGPRMDQAQMIPGVMAFFEECRQQSIKTYIVSHKTEYANYDTERVNLRSAALKWLEDKGFFDQHRTGLDTESVFFESTRQEKIDRIKTLGCKSFVDDLEETFLEKSFPSDVRQILYDPHNLYTPGENRLICSSWTEIHNELLGA